MDTPSFYWGTGRRKNALARVRVVPGQGKVLINNRTPDEYFPRTLWHDTALSPLKVAGVEGKVDVYVNASGGGLTGQSGAVRLGLARALLRLNPDLKPVLRKAGMLTRDSRMVERKKFGLKGARARYQYSKR